MDFNTGKVAKEYLNQECGVQWVVLQKISADEAKLVACMVYENPEMLKMLQLYTNHTRKLGETNRLLSQENFSLGMKLSKFAQNNFPTFVSIIERVSGFAVQGWERAEKEYARSQNIQAESVELYTELADDFEEKYSNLENMNIRLDREAQNYRNENKQLKNQEN